MTRSISLLLTVFICLSFCACTAKKKSAVEDVSDMIAVSREISGQTEYAAAIYSVPENNRPDEMSNTQTENRNILANDHTEPSTNAATIQNGVPERYSAVKEEQGGESRSGDEPETYTILPIENPENYGFITEKNEDDTTVYFPEGHTERR